VGGALAGARLRGLVGFGASHVAIDPVPFGTGTTLLVESGLAATAPDGWWNHLRVGLVRDTRDREVGPTRGSWSEVLVQRVDEVLGSETDHTRYTLTDRRYYSPVPRLVLANRFLLQQVAGDAPFHQLYALEGSFKGQEGLGGAKSVRGLPKNRYVGKGLFLWNAEARWRAAEGEAVGRRFHAVLSVFLDSGRVWTGETIPVDGLLSELHHGYGGGLRIGMGESFGVALDVGRSVETAAAIYIGVGYLF
jgi:outer membrane protein assembly factor BamA